MEYILLGIGIGGLLTYGYFYLFSEREYKKQNNALMVKHGKFGKWENLAEHIKKEVNK